MIIAVTGGIGCGKSVVSRVLRENGYQVYDTDTEAKRIMDRDKEIHRRLREEIHPGAVKEGTIDRRFIAEIVFNDATKLNALNRIVHKAVLDDIELTSRQHELLFVETALLYQSNIDLIADRVWEVTAPLETRIARVMNRNRCQRREVESRINSQDSFKPCRRHEHVEIIVNDGVHPILPRVMELLAGIAPTLR